MLSKLKDLRVILAIVLIISWVVAGVLFFVFKTNTDKQLALKDEDISNLQMSITDIGELVTAYTVVSDVPSGKQIEESDLEPIDVPISMSTNLSTDSEELVGKYFKLGLTAGTVITQDCVYEEVITPDMRYYDLIVDVVPIGLKPGAFVDIRIKYGTGADFIGVSHRQVAKVNGNVLKLILTEEDIHIFSMMLVENIIYDKDFQASIDINGDKVVNNEDKVSRVGSYIYAVEYVEGGIQDKAADYYAPSALVQGIMIGDKNILNSENLSANDVILRRKIVEAGIGAYDPGATAKEVRDVVLETVKEGQKEYDKRLEAELEAQNVE